MTPRRAFVRALVFAAVAAAATPGLLLLLAPFLGTRAAFALVSLALAAAWVASFATPLRARAGGLLLTALLGGLVLLGSPQRDAAFAAAAIVLAVARGMAIGGARPVRTLALEFALVAGGLAFAHAVAGPGLVGTALGTWGFYLVQALHPLGRAAGPWFGARGDEEPDAFERARARLGAWLEEGPSG